MRTKSLGKEEKKGNSQCALCCRVLYAKKQMWITPGLGNTINWCVTGPMLTTNRTEENFMVSGFGPEEAEKTCKMIKHLKIPYGGTLESLIENTTRENINKILVEEKVQMQALLIVIFKVQRSCSAQILNDRMLYRFL